MLNPILQYVYLVLLPTACLLSNSLLDHKKLVYILSAIVFLTLTYLFYREHSRLKKLLSSQKAYPFEQDHYFIFLRSFEKTEGYENQLTRIVPGEMDPTAGIYLPESIVGELDAAVREQEAKLVVLGGQLVLPIDHGVIWLQCPDRAWWVNFELLATHATGIIICPELTPGIFDELELIRNRNLLSKTIFFMSPTPQSSDAVNYAEPKNREKQWNEIQKRFQEEKILLPDYAPQGRLFSLDINSHVTRSVDIEGEAATNKVVDALRKFIGQQKLKGTPFKEVYPQLTLQPFQRKKVLLLATPGSEGFFAKTIVGTLLIWLSMALYFIHWLVPLAFWILFVVVLTLILRIHPENKKETP